MRRIWMAVAIAMLLAMPVRAAEEKLVALTFDDGPSGRFTRRLLTGLEEREAKATFFLCGYRLELYPELAERILEEGHEIGLHGYSHDSMAQMCACQLEDELENTMKLLPEGCKPVFLRPPGGKATDDTCRVAESWGLSLLYWSLDPKDWEIHDAGKITERVVSRAADGDVILMHDMSDSSVDAALAIVDILQKRGFRFVTASELAAEKGIDLKPGGNYTKFP